MLEEFGEKSWPLEAMAALSCRQTSVRATRRALLSELTQDVNLGRALGRLGLRRRRVDRFLAEEIDAEIPRGLSFGGLAPGWWRAASDGRTIALRFDRATRDGWLAMDLAGLALDEDDPALRELHRGRGGSDSAYELALLAVLLREGTLGKDAALLERAAALVGEEASPERVRVWIEGPAFVPPDTWEAPGAEVPAHRARWLLRNVDGLSVGGGALSVRTEPLLRAGRKPPPRAPRKERRRRLFSRWFEGIQVDESALVDLTPEAIALRIAEGARGVVMDGTCGAGGLTIAIARQPGVERVIAVDREPARIAMAKHNAALYGVAEKIEWHIGDVRDVLADTRPDQLVLDPPWGGRDYDRDAYDLDDLPFPLADVLTRFSGPVTLKLPRAFDVETLPGRWTPELMVDDRGVVKLLIARREKS